MLLMRSLVKEFSKSAVEIELRINNQGQRHSISNFQLGKLYLKLIKNII